MGHFKDDGVESSFKLKKRDGWIQPPRSFY